MTTDTQSLVRVPPGSLVQYYSDLAGGMLPPENMRLESLLFTVLIDPLGQVVTETQKVTLLARYQFAFRRVIGFAMDPDLSGAAPSLVSFNVKEEGRAFDVFKKPVSMGALVGAAGNSMEWDGVYITVPGTDLSVEWTIDTRNWPGLVGATKQFSVQLIGDYVVCQGGF